MNRNTDIQIIALFGLALVLGVVAGVLNFLGILPLFAGIISYTGALAVFCLLVVLALTVIYLLNRGSSGAHQICDCTRSYASAIIISSLIVLIVGILFVSIVATPIVGAIVLGVLLTFLFFALFLVAALLFCLLATDRQPVDPCGCRGHDDF